MMRPMESGFAPIGRDAVFERLARGHAGRITVLTPNRRLAQALARAFDEGRAGAGLLAWETADILPWTDFVERLWDEALHAPNGDALPLLLGAEEEQALWESSVADSRHAQQLLSATGPAAQCREAWRLLHAWRLGTAMASADCNEDASAFREWSARYERICRERRFVEAARLPDLVSPLVLAGTIRVPATLVLYAFDLLTPQLRDFLGACASSGGEVLACEAPRREGAAIRIELASPREEIAAAALWARSRLQEASSRPGTPAPRIGVVVPDLALSRRMVERVFAETMHPGHGAPGRVRPTRAFGLSLGAALSGFPIVNDALLLLSLAGQEISFEEASRLIRSPFLAGAQIEMAARARLDAALRERAGVTLTLERLVGMIAMSGMPHAPVLAERLGDLAACRRSDLFAARVAPDWAKAFAQALRAVGFPGDRGLDSAEFQALGKWHEILAAFGRLERVVGKMGYREGLNRLARMAAGTLFQPESPVVPVQVMGILESAGLDFDHLWVMGLTDDSWPLAARPNPFLPIRVQRAAGIPEADASTSLSLDRRITEGWLGAAPEVVISHARAKGDAEAAPSPLVVQVTPAGVEAIGTPATLTWRDSIHRAAKRERFVDEQGPAFAGEVGSGGTALFGEQAACPFRAFAMRRLGSTSPESPQPGLGAAERGTLLHAVLASAWEALGDKGRLDSASDEDLDAILAKAAAGALERIRRRRPHALDARFAALERDRLVRLGREWLEFERGRGDFAVVATESKVPATFGGITVNVKLDRLDRLAAGGCAVIDYKTGNASVSGWLGPRPDDPQLPLYALASGEDVAAVAIARVKVGEFQWKGLARSRRPDARRDDGHQEPRAACERLRRLGGASRGLEAGTRQPRAFVRGGRGEARSQARREDLRGLRPTPPLSHRGNTTRGGGGGRRGRR